MTPDVIPVISTGPAEERRLLVLASTSRDGEIASRVLTQAGINCVLCLDAHDMMRKLQQGAAGLLLVEEVLTEEALALLEDYIRHQPDWSDIPVLILTYHGADSPTLKAELPRLGKVSLLERPVRTTAFISAVKAA